MILNEKNLKNDCTHLDSSNVELLEWWKEYLCKWRVHSSCPKNCESYVKEKIVEILEK